MPSAIRKKVKTVVEAFRTRHRTFQLRKTQPHVTGAQIAAGLRQLGVERGDAVFVHSSLKSLGFVEGGPTAVIAAIADSVGPDGTVVLPTYYMPGGTILGTCLLTDYMFDARIHGTDMGSLPKAFLAFPGVHRSIHPTHSVSAVGRHARHVVESHHLAPSIFGTGSPWQRFLELENAKVLGLGITMGPVTFYHLVEDALGEQFPIRVWQDETYLLSCIDTAGKQLSVPVRPFDPALMARRIDHESRDDLRAFFAAEFEEAGLKFNGRVGQANSWYIPARGFFDHLSKLAQNHITIYSESHDLKCRRPQRFR